MWIFWKKAVLKIISIYLTKKMNILFYMYLVNESVFNESVFHTHKISDLT